MTAFLKYWLPRFWQKIKPSFQDDDPDDIKFMQKDDWPCD